MQNGGGPCALMARVRSSTESNFEHLICRNVLKLTGPDVTKVKKKVSIENYFALTADDALCCFLCNQGVTDDIDEADRPWLIDCAHGNCRKKAHLVCLYSVQYPVNIIPEAQKLNHSSDTKGQ